jgi:hypothetical protein
MQMWGAIAFGAASFTPPSPAATAVEFYVRADSPLDTINLGIQLNGEILPQLSLGHYLPQVYNCSLPTDWANTPVSVPLADLLDGKAMGAEASVRFNLKNSYQDNATIYVDSMRLV